MVEIYKDNNRGDEQQVRNVDIFLEDGKYIND